MKKLWPYLLLLFLALLFFVRFLDGRAVFAFKDLSRYFYPLRHLMVEQVFSGHLPLWNPFIFCGMPFLATLQIGFFYPLTFIYYVLPFTLAFNYYIIIHYFLASVFMYLMMRHFDYDKVAAVFSGIIFAYSGYLLSVSNMNTTMSSVIWLPLVILFWDKALRKQDLGSLVPTILFLCMMFLGGEPTIIYVTGWLMLFYGLIFGGNWRSTFIKLFLVCLFVAGIVAVQLIPFAELINHSDRVTLTRFDLISMRSLPPREIVNTVMPLFYGNQLRPGSYIPNILGRQNQDWLLSTYIGFIPLFFAFLGMLMFSKKSNFWSIAALASVLLAFGNYTPIYYFMYKIIPGISIIRFPVKYLFIAFFSMSIVAGMGLQRTLQQYFENNLQWLKKVAFILGIIVIVFGLICFFVKTYSSSIFIYYANQYKSMPPFMLNNILTNVVFNMESFNNLLLMVFLAAFGFYALYKGYLKKTMFCVFILGIVILDLFSINSPLNLPSSLDVYSKPTKNIEILQKDKSLFRYYYSPSFEGFNRLVYGDDFDKSLLEAKDRLVADRIIPYKLSDFYGYESVLLDDFRKFTSAFWYDMPQSNRKFLDALNIKYIINGDPVNYSNMEKLQSAQYFYGKSYLYKNDSCMQRAIVVPNAKYFQTRKAMLQEIKSKPFDPSQVVYLEGDTSESKVMNSVIASRVEMQKYDYDNVEINVVSSGPAYIFLSDMYYPGWKAFVDKKEVKIQRANLNFRAIPIPGGAHHVRFVYDPLSLKIGAIISIISIALLAFVYIKRKK